MPFDSDVALLGTGMAPLAAASHLLSQGKSVLLLNPDRDFFLENSELSLNPFLPNGLEPEKLARYSPEAMARELSPYFPGAMQNWPESSKEGSAKNFYDSLAPHLKNRARLWFPLDSALEDFYVEASDADLHPQILEGHQAVRKFPGLGNATQVRESDRGLSIPRLGDVDVSRYRNGVLEFLRERLGSERVICGASQVEPMPGGVRFHADGSSKTARLTSGMLVFWTPRLTSWVLGQCKRAEVTPLLPRGVRMWEQWSLTSRDVVESGVVGVWKNELAVWADGEGIPAERQLAVLRAGPLVPLDSIAVPQAGSHWASSESFGSLMSLCHDFFRWDKLTVRSMTPRAIFEWLEEPGPFRISSGDDSVRVVPACDGPLVDVVRMARAACEEVLKS